MWKSAETILRLEFGDKFNTVKLLGYIKSALSTEIEFESLPDSLSRWRFWFPIVGAELAKIDSSEAIQQAFGVESVELPQQSLGIRFSSGARCTLTEMRPR